VHIISFAPPLPAAFFCNISPIKSRIFFGKYPLLIEDDAPLSVNFGPKKEEERIL
jgi:hypothetical protein